MAQEKKVIETLNRNSFLYQKIADIAGTHFKREDYEKTLEWIRLAAHFAWHNHPSIFADRRLESMMLTIGKDLDDLTNNIKFTNLPEISANKSKQRVLHIATTVYGVGGHTRLIKNWIRAFDEFEHSLLLTEQQEYAVPDFLRKDIAQNGGTLIDTPNFPNLLQKARFVREAAQRFDYIFLHHHPDDVIAVVALATELCSPVAIVNHADHVFWLGSSVADLIIDFNRTGNVLSRERRGATNTAVVPFLLESNELTVSHNEARENLGIEQSETVLITIGSAYKYRPTEKHNFFRTTKKLLEQNKSAKLYLIGLDESDATEKNDQMIFLGVLENIVLYQAAADIYLDGFPYGGGLASIESVLLGACPVLAYGQMLDSSPRKMLEFETVITATDTEDEYITQVNKLIRDAALRKQITEKIASWIKSLHSKDKLPEYRRMTFDFLDKTKHQPQEIPDGSPQLTNADRSLALIQAAQQEKVSRVLRAMWDANSKINLSGFLYLIKVSLQSGDTKFNRTSLRGWLGTMWHKTLSSKKSENHPL